MIGLGAFFGTFSHNKTIGPTLTPGLTATTKIVIPPDLGGMFAASEDAYERATQEGYAENPAVIVAVTALKSAWTALRVANFNLMTAKGFFRVEFAAWRAARARRKTREACINLQAAIEQAAAENRLYNRCLILSSRVAT